MVTNSETQQILFSYVYMPAVLRMDHAGFFLVKRWRKWEVFTIDESLPVELGKEFHMKNRTLVPGIED